MSAPAILVENLEKYFPPALSGWRALLQPISRATERALAGISFRVEHGESVAVVGHNGAGKTTLLRILATLIFPSRGRASVGGFDVQRQDGDARKLLGYHTGGDEGFYARLSGRENLAFFASMNNLSGSAAKAKIDSIAGSLGISSELDRQVRTLSTGMVHRLGLARALVHGPSVLLLDEPTRSLDPLSAADFRMLLRQELVKRRGVTLFFASHALDEVEAIADRVILLDQGRIAVCDAPSKLRMNTGAATLEGAISSIARSFSPAGAIS
jgi:ABC-2 type transport system ATP-binding protein